MEQPNQENTGDQKPLGNTENSILVDEKLPRKNTAKMRVTWDEEALAAHEKTRGNKMKIDEPKTPYVSEEEFKRLCEEDPEYMKAFKEEYEQCVARLEREKNQDKGSVNSQEAANDGGSDQEMDEELQLAQENMKLNMNINLNAQINSDDDMNHSPSSQDGDQGQIKMGDLSNKLNTVKKQHNLPFAVNNFDIGSLASKLEDHADEQAAIEKSKQEFEERRKKHYENEFMIAKALLNKKYSDEEEDEGDNK